MPGHGVARLRPRLRTSFRPALSGTDGLGIPRALRLGIQRQVDAPVSRPCTYASASAADFGSRRFRGCAHDVCRLGRRRNLDLPGQRSACHCGSPNVRAVAQASEDARSSLQLPPLRPHRLRLAAGFGAAWGRRGALGHLGRHLGSVSPRADGRIHLGNGTLGRPAHPARVRGHAAAVEHEADVCGAGPAHCRLRAARLVRSACLPGLRALGVVGAAVFRDSGIGGTHLVRLEHLWDLSLRAGPRSKAAPGDPHAASAGPNRFWDFRPCWSFQVSQFSQNSPPSHFAMADYIAWPEPRKPSSSTPPCDVRLISLNPGRIARCYTFVLRN